MDCTKKLLQGQLMWDALEISTHALSTIQGDAKNKSTRIVRRALNWRIAMAFEAWSNNVQEKSKLKIRCTNMLKKWQNKSIASALNSWKSYYVSFQSKGLRFRKSTKTQTARPSTGVTTRPSDTLVESDTLSRRPKTATGTISSVPRINSAKMLCEDIRTPVVSSTTAIPVVKELSSRRMLLRAKEDLRAASSSSLFNNRSELLHIFKQAWCSEQLFADYRDSNQSGEGINSRYCLRALGRRTGTMDFSELLNLLRAKELLKERGDFDDPLKLSVSTAHSIFRVVNLKCYTSWWSTMKMKKSVDAFDGAADKYELGFREYQMVMLALARQLGLNMSDVTEGADCSIDPKEIEEILSLAKYNSNRLPRTFGAGVHVARMRLRDSCECAIDLLSSAISAAEIGYFDRARSMIETVGQLTAVRGRPDLLCEIEITANRVDSMEKSCLARESKMRANVDRILAEAESYARALEIEKSKKQLREAALVTAKEHYPRRDSLQSKFNVVMASLDEAELVIQGDDKIKAAWECIQRDELMEAKKHLDDARVAYASTQLRVAELKACGEAYDNKCRDEQRIRLRGQHLMELARLAISEERFTEAAQIMEQAKDAFSEWTRPTGKNALLVAKITSMIAKTWQNKPLFEAFCAFDDKNLSGQGSRAMMMDFNEFLFLLQDLGILEQRIKRGMSAPLQRWQSQEANCTPPEENSLHDLEDAPISRMSPTRRHQVELCNQCTYPEIRQNPTCKVAKADVYEIFRAVNLRSVLQLHRGNIEADDDMSSLNYTEYQLCMLRLGKLVGIPVTDVGASPLFLKDFKELDELREDFSDAKRKVRERVLQNGEHFMTLSKNAMQECSFDSAKEQLELAVLQYEKLDDEQFMKHYLANCKRQAELIDREEKKEISRKADLIAQAETSLDRVRSILEEFEQLGCKFEENKFKICELEADNARKYYKSAQSYGTQQKCIIEELRNNIQFSEQSISKLRLELSQGRSLLQTAEHMLEAMASMKDLSATELPWQQDSFFQRSTNAAGFRAAQNMEPMGNAYDIVLQHIEEAGAHILLSKDQSAYASQQSVLKRFANLAEEWVKKHRDAAATHLEEADGNLKRAIASSGQDWKAALNFLNKAEKARDRAKTNVGRAMQAKCAVPFFEKTIDDVFCQQRYRKISAEISSRDTEWKEQRIAEYAEGTKLMNDCKLLIEAGNILPAIQRFHVAKSLLKGEHLTVLIALEHDLQVKIQEDEIRTKELIADAKQRIDRAKAAQSCEALKDAIDEANYALKVVGQVYAIDTKEDARKLRDQANECLENILQAASIMCDQAAEKASEWLEEAVNFIYDLKYEAAENLILQVTSSVQNLESKQAVSLLKTVGRPHQGHQYISDRLEMAKGMVQRKSDVLTQLKSYERRIGQSAVDRAREYLQESKMTEKFSFEDLSFLSKLFDFGKRYLLKNGDILVNSHNGSDQLLADIGQNLNEYKEQKNLKIASSVQQAKEQISQAPQMLQSGNFLQALFQLEGWAQNSSPQLRKAMEEDIRSTRGMISTFARNYLQKQQSRIRNDIVTVPKKKGLRSLEDVHDSLSAFDVELRCSHAEEALFVTCHLLTDEDESLSSTFYDLRSQISAQILQIRNKINCFLHSIEDCRLSIDRSLVSARTAQNILDAQKFLDEARQKIAEINDSDGSHHLPDGELTRWTEECNYLESKLSEWAEEENQLRVKDEVTGASMLHSISAFGKGKDLLRLLKHNPDLREVDVRGWTASHYAAAHGNSECLCLLLEHQAEVNACDHSNETPLLIAVKKDHMENVRVLTRFGADCMIVGVDGRIALQHCVLQDRAEMIEKVLWGGLEYSDAQPSVQRQLDFQDDQGLNALQLACSSGYNNAARVLLSSGADPRQQEQNGMNCLHLTSKFGHADIIPDILLYLREVDCPEAADGQTSMMIACKYKQIKAARVLLREKADPNLQDRLGRSAIHIVCNEYQTSDAEMMNLLLAHKADISVEDNQGRSALLMACEDGHADLVQLLLQSMMPDQVEKFIDHIADAIFASLGGDQQKVVKVFLNVCPELCKSAKMGWNMLHAAVLMGNMQLLELILNSCPADFISLPLQQLEDFPIKDIFSEGDTALTICRKCIELSQLGVLLHNKSSYRDIEKKLLEFAQTLIREPADEPPVTTAFSKVSSIDVRCIWSACIPRASLHAPGQEASIANEILQDEQNALLTKIQIAQKSELEHWRSNAIELRRCLFNAEMHSRTGNILSASLSFTKALPLCKYNSREDMYGRALIEATEHRIVKNFVECQVQRLIDQIIRSSVRDVHDVEGEMITLNCLNGSETAATPWSEAIEALWSECANSKVIDAECKCCLSALVEKVEEDAGIVQMRQKEAMCQNLIAQTNSALSLVACARDFETFKEHLTAAKDLCAQLRNVIENSSKNPGFQESFQAYERLKVEFTALEHAAETQRYLCVARQLQVLPRSWFLLAWLKRVNDKCKGQTTHSPTSSSEINGGESIPHFTCERCRSTATLVLMNQDREIKENMSYQLQMDQSLCADDIEFVVEGMITEVSCFRQRFSCEEYELKIDSIISRCKDLFTAAQYLECLDTIQGGYKVIEDGLSDSLADKLRWLVVHQSLCNQLSKSQKQADGYLTVAEKLLNSIEVSDVCRDASEGEIDSQLKVLSSARSSLSKSKNLFQLAQDTRSGRVERLGKCQQDLEESNAMIVLAKVSFVMSDVLDEVEKIAKLELIQENLVCKIVHAKELYNAGSFLQCLEYLQGARREVLETQPVDRLQNIMAFEELEDLLRKAAAAMHESEVCHAAHRIFEMSRIFIAKKMYFDAAKCLEEIHLAFQVSDNVQMYSSLQETMIGLVETIISCLYRDLLEDLCGSAEAAIVFNLEKTLVAIAESAFLRCGAVFENVLKGDLGQGQALLQDIVCRVQAFSEHLKPDERSLANMISLGKEAEYLQDCISICGRVDFIEGKIGSGACPSRQNVSSLSEMVDTLDTAWNQLQMKKPGDHIIRYPNEFSSKIDGIAARARGFREHLAKALLDMKNAETKAEARLRDADLALRSGRSVECSEMLAACSAMCSSLDETCRPGVEKRLEELRGKADNHVRRAEMEARIAQSESKLEEMLRDGQFERAKLLVTAIIDMKRLRAALEMLST